MFTYVYFLNTFKLLWVLFKYFSTKNFPIYGSSTHVYYGAKNQWVHLIVLISVCKCCHKLLHYHFPLVFEKFVCNG